VGGITQGTKSGIQRHLDRILPSTLPKKILASFDEISGGDKV